MIYKVCVALLPSYRRGLMRTMSAAQRIVMSTAMLIALGFGAVMLPAAAQAQSDQDKALRARQDGGANLSALKSKVEKKLGGKVLDVTTTGSGNALKYQFSVLRGAEVVRVLVDVKTGKILQIREPK